MPARLLQDLSLLDLNKTFLQREQVAEILPHRGTMAVIDAICVFDRQDSFAVGRKDVRLDEFWVPGHFPGDPLMPGVILVEAAAQVSLVCYKLLNERIARRLVVFGGMEHVRFRGPVRPGDRLHLIAKMLEISSRGARAATQAVVCGKVVYEGEILAIVT